MRRLAGRAVKGGGRWLQRGDPAYVRARRLFRHRPPRRALLLCVYRAKNARFVTALAAQARQLGIEMRLWALDSVAPALAEWTYGAGPGPRMELLNRLWSGAAGPCWDRVAICDDDFVFTRGDLASLLDGCEVCGFDIAQPAHAVGSYAGRHFPRSRVFTIARLTSWVDVGPMFIVSGAWLKRVLPFPEQAGMGWGLGLIWGQLRHEGCRLGIVDGICVRHLFPPRLEYDNTPESTRVAGILRSLNLESTTQAQRCLSAWKFWQPGPPWQP
jgi:hypothetical protein